MLLTLQLQQELIEGMVRQISLVVVWYRSCECVSVYVLQRLSLWLIGAVRAQPETVISRTWVQSPDPAE